MKERLAHLLLIFLFSLSLYPQQSRVDSLENVLKTVNDPFLKIKLILKQCEACDLKDNLKYGQEGIDACNLLLNTSISEAVKQDLLKSETEFIKFQNYYFEEKKDYYKLIQNALLLRQIYYRFGDTSNAEINYSQIAFYLHQTGKNESAIDSLRFKLAFFEKINDLKRIAFYSKKLGEAYDRINDAKNSLKYFSKSLVLYKELKNQNAVANCLSQLAQQYALLHDNKKSVEYCYEYLNAVKSRNQPQDLYWIYWRISDNYGYTHKLDSALHYDSLCLKIAEQLGEKVLIGNAYGFIADSYQLSSNHVAALKFEEKGLIFDRESGDTVALMRALDRTARICRHLKYYDKAIAYAGEGEILAKKRGDIYLLKQLSYLQFVCYKENGQPAQALNYHLNYVAYNDSIEKIESRASIQQSELSFEYDRKEQQRQEEQRRKAIIELEEKEKQAILRNSFIVGTVLLGIILFITFRSYRNKQKANELLQKKNHEIAEQKQLLEDKQKEILDSINYARRIQRALITSEKYINKEIGRLGARENM